MKKFTLLELLVVIAIIGILTTILIPSLSKARDKSYQAMCLNNLKQSGIAIQMYLDTYDGKVITITRTANSDWSTWNGWARELVNTNFMEIKSSPEYACPKADTSDLEGTATYHSYGVNARLTTENTDNPNNSWQQGDINGTFHEWLTPSSVPEPVDTMLLMDTRSGLSEHVSKQKSYIKNMTAEWIARVWTIHNPSKSATAIFVDGHASVESVTNFRLKMGTNIDFSNSESD